MAALCLVPFPFRLIKVSPLITPAEIFRDKNRLPAVYIYINNNNNNNNNTSSNQRLWECVRCRINVYTDTLNDFPSWLSTSKNQPFFINNRGFTERFQWQSLCQSDWLMTALRDGASFRRLTCLIGLKNLHQPFKFRAKYYHIDL